MNYGNEEEGWDTLASSLGLEPPPKSSPPPHVEKKVPDQATPIGESLPREEVIRAVPARVPRNELKVASVVDDAESAPFGEGIVEDAADVLDDEAPDGPETAGEEEPAEGEGKGRRRRRRRRRKKGGPEAAADNTAIAESPAVAEEDESGDADLLAFPSVDDDDAAGDEGPPETFDHAPELQDDEEEVEEIIPAVALAQEEDESTEPLPEWKVTAWTDLIATLYRPQDR
jgi:ribonuclease E